MCVTPEAPEYIRELVMHHRVVGDLVSKNLLLLAIRQFTVEKEMGHFNEIAMLCQLLYGLTAVVEQAFVAIDIGNAGTTRGRR